MELEKKKLVKHSDFLFDYFSLRLLAPCWHILFFFSDNMGIFCIISLCCFCCHYRHILFNAYLLLVFVPVLYLPGFRSLYSSGLPWLAPNTELYYNNYDSPGWSCQVTIRIYYTTELISSLNVSLLNLSLAVSYCPAVSQILIEFPKTSLSRTLLNLSIFPSEDSH